MSDAFQVRRMATADVTFGFSCGRSKLDEYLVQRAASNNVAGWSATSVVLEGLRVVGFVTTVPAAVEAKLVRKVIRNLPGYPAPVLLLARMGANLEDRGRGVGPLLMDVAYRGAVELADRFGCVGLLTHAKAAGEGQPDARPYYAGLGFAVVEEPATEGDPTTMFLTMAKVREKLAAG